MAEVTQGGSFLRGSKMYRNATEQEGDRIQSSGAFCKKARPFLFKRETVNESNWSMPDKALPGVLSHLQVKHLRLQTTTDNQLSAFFIFKQGWMELCSQKLIYYGVKCNESPPPLVTQSITSTANTAQDRLPTITRSVLKWGWGKKVYGYLSHTYGFKSVCRKMTTWANSYCFTPS